MDDKRIPAGALHSLATALYPENSPIDDAVTATVTRYGEAVLRFLLRSNCRIRILRHNERYDEASGALKRLGVDVDGWPAPPAGLFVVEERTVYLRSHSAMTVAHETAHAIDCALGGGVYYSSINADLRRLFAGATAYVSPYAATGSDEYFAESCRAFIEANDPASFWPRATRSRLRRIDAAMFSYIETLLNTEIPNRVYGDVATKSA